MAVPPPPLPERRLIEALFRAIKHVFETNLVRRTDMVRTLAPEQLLEIVRANTDNFTISAIRASGDCECTICVVTPAGLNFAFARDFLDVDDSMLQLGAEIPVYRDAAGEMNNMMAGVFRNMLSRGGLQMRLTPPIIINGVEHLIASLARAKTGIVAEIKVEEFLVYVSLWT
jgi:hypothetical protein